MKPYRTIFLSILDAHPQLCRETRHLARFWPVCEVGGKPSAYPTLLLGMLQVVRAVHPSSMPSLGKHATDLHERLLRASADLSTGASEDEHTVAFIHNVLLEHLKLCVGLGKWVDPLKDPYQSRPWQTMDLSLKYRPLQQYYEILREGHELIVRLSTMEVPQTVNSEPRLKQGYSGSAVAPYLTNVPMLRELIQSLPTAVTAASIAYAVNAIQQLSPFFVKSAIRLGWYKGKDVMADALRLYDRGWTSIVPPGLYNVRSVPYDHPISPAITTRLMHEALSESLEDIRETYGDENAQALWEANRAFVPWFFRFTGACEEAAEVPGISYYYGDNLCSVARDTYFEPYAITPESAKMAFARMLRIIETPLLSSPNPNLSDRPLTPQILVEGYKWILEHFTRVSFDEVLYRQYHQLAAVLDEAADGDIVMMVNRPYKAGSAAYFGAHLLVMCKQLLRHHAAAGNKRLHFYFFNDKKTGTALQNNIIYLTPDQDGKLEPQEFNLARAHFDAWSTHRWVQGKTRIHLVYMNDGDYSGHQLTTSILSYGDLGIRDIPERILPPHVLDSVHLVVISAVHTSRALKRIHPGPDVDYRGGATVEVVSTMMEREQVSSDLRNAILVMLESQINKPLIFLDFKIPDSYSIPRMISRIDLIEGANHSAFYRATTERRAIAPDQTILF